MAKSPCKPRPYRLTRFFRVKADFSLVKELSTVQTASGKLSLANDSVACSYRACPCSGSRIETESLLRGLCSCLSHLGRVRSPRPWTGGLFYKAGKV